MLSKSEAHFTLAVPVRQKWVKQIIDQNSSSLCLPDNRYVLDDQEAVYCQSQLYNWPNSSRQLYLHLYYSEVIGDDIIQEYKDKYDGFFCILSTFSNDPIELLSIFHNRFMIDNSFNDIKTDIDNNILHINTPTNIDSILFLRFLSLIFIYKLNNIISTTSLLKNYSHKMLLNTMETLQRANVKGSQKNFYSESDKIQDAILDIFGLQWPVY
jgi:hypothetical protein